MAAKRIQLSRRKGWRKPEGVVVVSRPSKFGNPFTAKAAIDTGFAKDAAEGRAMAVEAFREWLEGRGEWWIGPESARRRGAILAALPLLRGKDLACWCGAGPCHADVLLELANA